MSTLGIKKGIYIDCPVCKTKFYISKCFIGKRRCCSYKCANEFQKKPKVLLKCLECGKPFERHKRYLEVRISKYCSVKCQSSAAAKNQKGEQSHNWKGGVYPKNKLLRTSAAWREWRRAVFERDNYTCQKCNIKSGLGSRVELHPHHIKQFAYYPELRFDISNGVTVCKPCHKIIHQELGLRKMDSRYGDIKEFKDWLKEVHANFMKQRTTTQR